MEGTQRKQPVLDADDDGKPIRSWLWQCDYCGERAIEPEGIVPEGWDVEDADDLENTASMCNECMEELGEDEDD